MRRVVIPAALFAAVFLVSLLCMPYTLVCQEYEGLFLATPDWWARAWQQTLPVSGIVSDFLIQFYRVPAFGALITAVLITLAFLLCRGISGRFTSFSDAVAALAAALLWVFVAHSSSPKSAVFVVLVLLVLFLLSLLISGSRKQRHSPSGCLSPKSFGTLKGNASANSVAASVLFAALFIVAAAAVIVFSSRVQRTERFSRVKADAIYGVWDDLLKTVPPAVAEKDGELTPFALLALSGKGQLGDRMFSYPVAEENDLDMVAYDGKEDYYTSLLFKACLYQFLGCYNEAIHNYYQWSTQLPQGTGFVVLRRLAELYCLQGNYTLMEKYCRILDKSLLNGAYVRHFRKLASQGAAQEPTPAAERSTMAVISHDPLYNLFLLESAGFSSAMSTDRMLCTLILKKDFVRFKRAMKVLEPTMERIPRHYQEVMLFAGMDSGKIDAAVKGRYASFLTDRLEMTLDQALYRYEGSAFPYLGY